MAISVKLFANLREQFGHEQAAMEFEEGMSLSDIWVKISGGEKMPSTVMVAVNMEYVNGEVELKDGDEVAFFPPVSGG
ncbi:MAG: molybdopterin converting factor subunit 1 [Gammaproteobacteria bacterium]